MSAPMISDCNQDAARAHGSSLQRLVRAPFYSDEWVTIYNADAREMVEELEPGFALLTDPVYGINGGRDSRGMPSKTSRKRAGISIAKSPSASNRTMSYAAHRMRLHQRLVLIRIERLNE